MSGLLTKRDAAKAGAKRGRAAASWVFDGNTTDATYRAFLAGNEDGDPAVMDQYATPEWLSGQWAGESVPELLGECRSARDEARLDGVMQAYCDAADLAYWAELERIARFHVGGAACSECGALIPDRDGGSVVNRHHAASCSAFEPAED